MNKLENEKRKKSDRCWKAATVEEPCRAPPPPGLRKHTKKKPKQQGEHKVCLCLWIFIPLTRLSSDFLSSSHAAWFCCFLCFTGPCAAFALYLRSCTRLLSDPTCAYSQHKAHTHTHTHTYRCVKTTLDRWCGDIVSAKCSLSYAQEMKHSFH